MPKQQPIQVRTLADLSERVCLYAHCNTCRHSGRLGLHALKDRYGALELTKLRARLRCSACGSRDIELQQVWSG